MIVYFSATGNCKYVAERIAGELSDTAVSIEKQDPDITIAQDGCWRILKKRNIILDASFSVKMPDTWTPIFDLSDPDEVAKQNSEAEKYIDTVIKKVLSREKGNQTEHRMPYAVRVFTDPILNSERRTKNFYVEDTCIGCGLCAKL